MHGVRSPSQPLSGFIPSYRSPTRQVMLAFTEAVRSGYNAVPFHNFSHAVYVLQGCHAFYQQSPLLQARAPATY